MDETDLNSLGFKIEDFRDIQQDITDNINDFLNTISTMEKQFDKEYNLSFVLAALREKLESLDVDNMFSFVNDLESEVESLSYNYRRAEKANGISTYKVVNKQMPIYFKPTGVSL